MSQHTAQIPSQTHLLEQAADWVIDLNDAGSPAESHLPFNPWIRRSPDHLQAYFEMAATWELADQLDSSRRSSPDAIVARALAQESGTRQLEFTGRKAAYACFGTLLFLIGLFATWRSVYHSTYVTAIGEQRIIALSDGSTIQLNTRSRIRLRDTRTERGGQLVDGQALFEVRVDPARPFIVQASPASIRALGTQFDVYRAPDQTIITVYKGSVSVTEETAHRDVGLPQVPIVLNAGQQLAARENSPPQIRTIDIGQALAWTRGELVFDETPLHQVVREMNRYNVQAIRIDNPALAAMHIRGTFNAKDPQTLLRFLQSRFQIKVTRKGQDLHISKREP